MTLYMGLQKITPSVSNSPRQSNIGIKANFLVLNDTSENGAGYTISPVCDNIDVGPETTSGYSTGSIIGPVTNNQIHPFQETLTINNNRYRISSNTVEIHLSALKTITNTNDNTGFNHCAQNNTNLTIADFSGLETFSGANIFQYAFSGCTNLETLDFSNLVSVSGTGSFLHMIEGCSKLKTLYFPKLTTIVSSPFLGSAAAGGAFANSFLENLYFPSLTSSTNMSSSTFNHMLKGVTGCTVHFPSNLQSTMSSWSSVTSGFSGTNTVVLWDLPATS